MCAFGLGGTEVPIHVEDGGITNERGRSGRDIAHLKLVGFEGLWFDTAHLSHLPFTVARELRSCVRHSRRRLVEPVLEARRPRRIFHDRVQFLAGEGLTPVSR